MEYLEKLPNVRMTFREFYINGLQYNHHNLYVVEMSRQTLYVGISKVNVWSRWFGERSPHIYANGNEWEVDSGSRIGQVIVHNHPSSLEWTIELHHHRDYLVQESLQQAEMKLIRKLRPLFNTIYSSKRTQKELDMISKLEAWKREITLQAIPMDLFR